MSIYQLHTRRKKRYARNKNTHKHSHTLSRAHEHNRSFCISFFIQTDFHGSDNDPLGRKRSPSKTISFVGCVGHIPTLIHLLYMICFCACCRPSQYNTIFRRTMYTQFSLCVCRVSLLAFKHTKQFSFFFFFADCVYHTIHRTCIKLW